MRLTNRPHTRFFWDKCKTHYTKQPTAWVYQHVPYFWSTFTSYEVYRCTSCICFQLANLPNLRNKFIQSLVFCISSPWPPDQLWFRAALPSCLSPIQSSQEANQQKKPIQKVRKECNVPQRECQSDIRNKIRETRLKCSDFVSLLWKLLFLQGQTSKKIVSKLAVYGLLMSIWRTTVYCRGM